MKQFKVPKEKKSVLTNIHLPKLYVAVKLAKPFCLSKSRFRVCIFAPEGRQSPGNKEKVLLQLLNYVR